MLMPVCAAMVLREAASVWDRREGYSDVVARLSLK